MILPALSPALVGGGVLLLAARARVGLAGLAVALGYVTTHTLLLGLPELEPIAAVERMPWILLAVGVVIALGGLRASSVGDAALLLVCAAGAWWVTESARSNDLTGASGHLLLGGLALASYSSSQTVRSISSGARAWVPPLLIAVAALALAPALLMGRTAVLGQLSGAVCATSCAAVFLCRRPGFEEAGMLAAAAAAPALPLLAACGALYAYLDPLAAACIGLSPLFAGAGLQRGEDWSARKGLGALTLLSLLGLWLAYQGMPAASSYGY